MRQHCYVSGEAMQTVSRMRRLIEIHDLAIINNAKDRFGGRLVFSQRLVFVYLPRASKFSID